MSPSESAIEAEFEHETLLVERRPEIGLTAVIAVHSTALGPAAGGLRILPYATLTEAAIDALRLSAAMTLKTAAAGLPLGGGKAVLVRPPDWADRVTLMQTMGELIERLGGRYVVGEDIGTSPTDMDVIARRTDFVTGLSPERGGRGDPSPATATTVFGAIRDALTLADGAEGLAGKTVGVLGVGKVGAALTRLLSEAGAAVTVADIDAVRASTVAEEYGAMTAGVEGFAQRDFDVLAPCARGQLLSLDVVDTLRCRVVAGAANNQLASPAAAEALAERGVLYVPDFIANCGGVIYNFAEYFERDPSLLRADLNAAMDRTRELLLTARARGVSPLTTAVEGARRRVEAAGHREE